MLRRKKTNLKYQSIQMLYVYKLYAARMGKTIKARVNLTVDPDIYRKARHVFDAMDMNMSAFMEIQLAKFLQNIEPIVPLLEQAERGELDAADAKAAMRVWFAHSIGQTLSDSYQVAGEHMFKPLDLKKRRN